MVAWEFEPLRTREIVAHIADLFGLGDRVSSELEALFVRLAKMDVGELSFFAEHAGAQQVDMLCHHYHQAPSSAALLAITILLCLRRDKRWSDVGRFFFFNLPCQRELQRLVHIWPELAAGLQTAVDSIWLVRFLENSQRPAPLDFVISELKLNRFSFDHLNEGFLKTPLFDKLVDFLFLEGGPLLAKLQPEPAADRAARFLVAGDELRVRGYLMFYPAAHWQPALLEKICAVYGPPDQSSVPFFRHLDESIVWRFRQKLFSARMMTAGSNKEHQAYWMDRLHRCQDWRALNGEVQITILPLKIVERDGHSLISMASNPGHVLRKITHNYSYGNELDELMVEYLGW